MILRNGRNRQKRRRDGDFEGLGPSKSRRGDTERGRGGEKPDLRQRFSFDIAKEA